MLLTKKQKNKQRKKERKRERKKSLDYNTIYKMDSVMKGLMGQCPPPPEFLG